MVETKVSQVGCRNSLSRAGYIGLVVACFSNVYRSFSYDLGRQCEDECHTRRDIWQHSEGCVSNQTASDAVYSVLFER